MSTPVLRSAPDSSLVGDGEQPLLLKIEGLLKDYPGQRALDGVDLELRPGEVRALLGHNGAGKSTIVRILAGATPATEGRMFFQGRLYNPHSPSSAREAGIGIVYQNAPIIETLSVAENLVLGFPYPRRLGFLIDWNELTKWAHERWVQALGDLRPPPYGALMNDLTPRDHWLVAIARAVLHSPKLLVLDESTVAFSAAETEAVHMTIRRLADEGVGIIYVTHRLQEALAIADTVTILRDGKVRESCNSRDITQDALIRHLAGERVAQVQSQEKDLSKQMGQPILDCVDLSCGVIDRLSFSLNKGEILGIAGLEGSGARDLLRALFGTQRVKSGDIHLNGQSIPLRNPSQAIKLGFGFLPSDRLQQAVLTHTICHTVTLPSLRRFRRQIRLLDGRRQEEETEVLAKRLEVKMRGVRDEMLSLSGGNRQKVVLAKWLMTNPTVLLVEEPTQGVDVGAAFEIRRFIRSLADEGLSVIVATADLKELVELCDRVIVLCGGRVSDELSRPFSEEQILTACYRIVT